MNALTNLVDPDPHEGVVAVLLQVPPEVIGAAFEDLSHVVHLYVEDLDVHLVERDGPQDLFHRISTTRKSEPRYLNIYSIYRLYGHRIYGQIGYMVNFLPQFLVPFVNLLVKIIGYMVLLLIWSIFGWSHHGPYIRYLL